MSKNTFITAFIIGAIASIAFILIQPLFGMATLTSRHAGAYVNLGSYAHTPALILAWCVHVSVSIIYALLATLIFNINRSWPVSLGQILVWGWLTTLIATPANEWVVKLITSKQLPDMATLSALNTQIGPKLWLHMVFFVFVMIGLVISQSAQRKQGEVN